MRNPMAVRDKGQMPGSGIRSPWNSRCATRSPPNAIWLVFGREHGGAGAACFTAVTDLIPALTLTKTASTATTTPGSVVQYTITVADTGQTPYTSAAVTDDLTSVLDEAA
jgi:uncharacterized repeat protein (TIGR01451 family)